MKFSKGFLFEFIFLLQGRFSSCDITSPLIQKAVFIADSTFERNFVTSIVSFPPSELQVTDFIKNFNGSVVVTLIQNENEKFREFDKTPGFLQTVLFATDLNEFIKFVALLKPVMVDPIRLIVVLTKSTTDVEISALTKTAWVHDVADIVIVSMDQNNIKLTTYNPYSNNGICGDHTPVQMKPDETKWFPKKFYNFHGCPIRVALLDLVPYNNLDVINDTVQSISGMDGILFDLLLEKLNARMDYILCEGHGYFGEVYENGTTTGCYIPIFNNIVDIISPAIIIEPLKAGLMQKSSVFEYLVVSWFGPPRREKEKWLKILQPFMTDTSKAIVVSFVLFIIITSIVQRYGHEKVDFKLGVIFQSFIMFLGQEVRFESNSWLLNSLFVKWIWFCMIVRFVYQGDLVDGLQKNVQESPLKHFPDAVKEVDGYGGLEYIRNENFEGTKYYDDYILIDFSNLRIAMEELSNGKRLIVNTAEMLALELGRGLQLLDDPITRSPVAFLMRPGWPASTNFDMALLGLAQSGYIEKILTETRYNMTKDIPRFVDRGAEPLNMDTLIGCFYGLGFLYIMCILVFIGEIIYHKYKMKSQTLAIE